MKKLLMAAMALIVAISPAFAKKSEQKDIRKERTEIRKMTKSDLDKKVDKAAKKAAKKYTKEGWQVKPGALPLDKQLDRSYNMQYEYDANLFPKYVMGEASSVGENYDAAKTAAISLAITNLAAEIQTEVTALIENTVANKQLAPDEAASIVETVTASKNLISQKIGRTIPVIEAYRVNDKKNTEVLIRLAYNAEMAKDAVRAAVREDLEKKGAKLHEQLDQALGF